MKNSFFIFFFAVLLALSAGLGGVYGQCPETTPDFPNIPWSTGDCITIMVNECSTEVCYCYRVIVVNNVEIRFDYLITSIDLLGNDDCVWQYIDDWSELISFLGEKLVLSDPEDLGPCPPCPERDFRYMMMALECWQYPKEGAPESVHVSNILKLQASFDSQCEESFCVQGFGICCNPTTGEPDILVNGEKVHYGTVDCDDVPANGYITTNTCYKFAPCDQN